MQRALRVPCIMGMNKNSESIHARQYVRIIKSVLDEEEAIIIRLYWLLYTRHNLSNNLRD